jgi:hypothetical protein
MLFEDQDKDATDGGSAVEETETKDTEETETEEETVV